MRFTHKNNIARGLVGGDNNIFVMKERQVFSNIWVFKNWCRASAHRLLQTNPILPSLYWIPKLHKCPFKQPYIDGSAKCSTKPLSKLLTMYPVYGFRPFGKHIS
jgi:hypothetical protein